MMKLLVRTDLAEVNLCVSTVAPPLRRMQTFSEPCVVDFAAAAVDQI